MRSMLWMGAAAVVLTAVAACDTGTEFDEQLEDQLRSREQLWAQAGSTSYTFRLLRECGCPDVYDVRLEVEDGVVVAGTHAISGDPLTAAEVAKQLTLPDLFEVVRDAIGRDAAEIQVSYNSQYGFVQSVFINYDLTRGDDDVAYSVSEYSPTTT